MNISSQSDSPRRQVFIIRLWRVTRGAWRVQVQDIRTGQIAYARGLNALTHYLARHLESTEPAPAAKNGLR